jgi:hypothetical protein
MPMSHEETMLVALLRTSPAVKLAVLLIVTDLQREQREEWRREPSSDGLRPRRRKGRR